MQIKFIDKIVIVNGGSRGIGSEIVKSFCNLGARVYFTYRNSKNAAQKIIEEYGANTVSAHCIDNNNLDSISSFVTDVGKKHKCIDVLVNNAGIVKRSLIPILSSKDWDESFSVNLMAPMVFAKAAVRYMRKSDNPSIINISSVTADRASRGLAAYCSSKSALESLTRVMAMEFANFSIRVNTIAPGFIETDVAKNTSDEYKRKILDRTPLGRLGTTKEVSNTVLFLASSYASYITGSQIYVTGGRHLE